MEQLIRESDALHARVQRFVNGASSETFEQLALAIAQFQAEHSPGFARLVERHTGSIAGVETIPAVPCDAFRLARVAAHPPALDAVRFVTSGTTGSERGYHFMRRTDTYELASLSFGRAALLAAAHAAARPVVVALAPAPDSHHGSSLAFMLEQFMHAFDGEPLLGEAAFTPRSRARWLLDAAGVDLAGFRAAAAFAESAERPVLLLATAFALARLLEQLEPESFPLPSGSVIMQTGGFKGKTREIEPSELRARLTQTLYVPPERIVGEYGMTELTSQLYEPTLPESRLARQHGNARRYVAPPWLRVSAVDPVTLAPLAPRQIGLARFVDLGNVDSAVCIVTQDLVRCDVSGIELVGRLPAAEARGCSLAVEALLDAH
jgi:hypothetical protein